MPELNMNVISIVGFVALTIVILSVAWWRYRDMRDRMSEMEADLEAQMMKETSIAEAMASGDSPEQGPAAPGISGADSPAPDAPEYLSTGPYELYRRLVVAGAVAGDEERIEAPGAEEKALLVRLRRGGSALIVPPDAESDWMDSMLLRYDVLIVARGDAPRVVRRFEDFLGDQAL